MGEKGSTHFFYDRCSCRLRITFLFVFLVLMALASHKALLPFLDVDLLLLESLHVVSSEDAGEQSGKVQACPSEASGGSGSAAQ